MAFQTALSGLSAAQDQLNVTGNNISNSATTGFKYSRAEFGDLYASGLASNTSTQVGAGVKLNQVAQQFSQGNLSFTNNNLDLAISGQGFFVTHGSTTDATPYYTRAGAFSVNKDGYVVNSQGHVLQVSQNGGSLQNLQINTKIGSPQATSTVGLDVNLNASSSNTFLKGSGTVGGATISSLAVPSGPSNPVPSGTSITLTYNGGSATAAGSYSASGGWTPTSYDSSTNTITLTNGSMTVDAALSGVPATSGAGSSWTISGNNSTFDPTDSSTYNYSTSTTTYDSVGTAHTVTFYFQKAATGDWNVYQGMSGGTYSGGTSYDTTPQTLQFNSSGQVSSSSSLTFNTFTPSGGAQSMTPTIDFSGSTQYGSSSAVNSVTQDGYTTGDLSGVTINSSGDVTAQYTNGSSDNLGTVMLANFPDPQGLQQVGNANWLATTDAGNVVINPPGVGTMGKVQSGALESSNVDLSKQLVNMILAQRNYQANAKAISTQDQIEQTIMNIQ